MTSIVFFYATWCGHCNEFKPTWEKIKEWSKTHNVTVKEYENEQVEAMTVDPSKNDSGIPMEMIEGYPSIFIIKNGDIQFVEKRDKDYIIRLLGGDLPISSDDHQKGGKREKPIEKPVVQTGGSKYQRSSPQREIQQNDFREKYLKYKKKYLNSKK
jgi:thiol-disulfide isomerase/thioredoxin